MDVNQLRNLFDSKINALLRIKREDNKSFLNGDEYATRVKNVKQSKIVLRTPGMKKNAKDYRIVSRYDVLTENGRERLIKPMNEEIKNVIYFVTNEELFDIVHSTHLAIGHGGRNRMIAELKTHYANITTETVMTYLELCAACQKKHSHPKKGQVSKSILQSSFKSTAEWNQWTVGQVEALIDQYKKYPVLYDTNHEEFANAEVKSTYLTNIVDALQSVRLGVTEVDITSQWNNLMIKYAEATQAQHRHNSETAASQELQFWYLDKLEFLQNHIKAVEVELEEYVDFDDANLFEPEITTNTHESRVGTDPLTTSFEVKEEIEESPPMKRMRENEDSEFSETSREDESEIFAKFVASLLRKITNEEVKQNAIFEIHKILYEALKRQ